MKPESIHNLKSSGVVVSITERQRKYARRMLRHPERLNATVGKQLQAVLTGPIYVGIPEAMKLSSAYEKHKRKK